MGRHVAWLRCCPAGACANLVLFERRRNQGEEQICPNAKAYWLGRMRAGELVVLVILICLEKKIWVEAVKKRLDKISALRLYTIVSTCDHS